jgi:hypothetical protein
MKLVKVASILAAALVLCGSLSGCLVVGYTSEGGWWVWPGCLVVTLILVLAWLLTRR